MDAVDKLLRSKGFMSIEEAMEWTEEQIRKDCE